MTNLDFLNKNMYRKYPLRASCNLVFTDGNICPQDIITSMQISTVFGTHKLYITKIYVEPTFISVTVNNYEDGTVLGCFAGKVLKDYQNIPLISTSTLASGCMTTGTLAALYKLPKGTYHLRDELNDLGSRDNGLIEDSTIFCFTPPAVSKILGKGEEIVGKATTLRGENLSISYPVTDEIKLTVTNERAIRSNSDFSGAAGNCNTPVIKKINSVFPDVNGNIDVYGILPVVIDVLSGELSMDSGLDITDVCPEKNKISPPVDETDVYYTDILLTSIPEWKTWPNFT